MMPQKHPEFRDFGEAAVYFYNAFSKTAPPRFERYLQASSNREIEAIARYRWNLGLCESLLPCLHAAELALRNAIHQAMQQAYLPCREARFPDGKPADAEWWFDVQVRGKSILKDRDYDKVAEAYCRVPKNGKPITPRVVAELPFGFWVELLNSGYDETIVVPMLGSTMQRVQKGTPTNRNHGWLRERFGEIRNLRNRVTHHEPVYHLTNLSFVWQMAWQLASEITPWFTPVIQPTCRFESLRRAGWQSHEVPIRALVKTQLYEPYKKE